MQSVFLNVDKFQDCHSSDGGCCSYYIMLFIPQGIARDHVPTRPSNFILESLSPTRSPKTCHNSSPNLPLLSGIQSQLTPHIFQSHPQHPYLPKVTNASHLHPVHNTSNMVYRLCRDTDTCLRMCRRIPVHLVIINLTRNKCMRKEGITRPVMAHPRQGTWPQLMVGARGAVYLRRILQRGVLTMRRHSWECSLDIVRLQLARSICSAT